MPEYSIIPANLTSILTSVSREDALLEVPSTVQHVLARFPCVALLGDERVFRETEDTPKTPDLHGISGKVGTHMIRLNS